MKITFNKMYVWLKRLLYDENGRGFGGRGRGQTQTCILISECDCWSCPNLKSYFLNGLFQVWNPFGFCRITSYLTLKISVLMTNKPSETQYARYACHRARQAGRLEISFSEQERLQTAGSTQVNIASARLSVSSLPRSCSQPLSVSFSHNYLLVKSCQ